MKQNRAGISQPRSVVLGLGNPILSDDAAGLAVTEQLRLLLEDHPIHSVDILDSTRAGFELIDMLQGYDSAFIVDALDIPGEAPGKVVKLSLTDFAGSARLNNPHEISVSAAFDIAERLGIAMPTKVTIFGIIAADVRSLSEQLSPEVAAAIVPLANQLHYLLKTSVATVSLNGQPVQSPGKAFYPPTK